MNIIITGCYKCPLAVVVEAGYAACLHPDKPREPNPTPITNDWNSGLPEKIHYNCPLITDDLSIEADETAVYNQDENHFA